MQEVFYKHIFSLHLLLWTEHLLCDVLRMYFFYSLCLCVMRGGGGNEAQSVCVTVPMYPVFIWCLTSRVLKKGIQ